MQDNETINGNAEEEVNLLHYLLVILKRKKMILGVTLACAFVTAAVSVIMRPVYRAETRILPPQRSGSSISAQILSELGGVSGLFGGSLGVKNPNDIYVGMLKSRTIYDRIIDRFGLMEVYRAEYREDARKELDDAVIVKSGKDEIVSVSVEDEDPNRAANMANAFIEELKEITQRLAVTEASQRRLFFGEQLDKVKQDLIASEDAMRKFQEKTGAVKMDAQAEAVIRSITMMRAELAAKEVQLNVMRTYAKPNNPDLQRTEVELRGLRDQLRKLEAKDGENPDPLVPTGRMPQVGADYIRKLRDLRYQETLFELMAKQYEIARVDEARDATVIQVLDIALPPDKRARPKRALMVVIATFTGFFLAVFAAFFMEYMERISQDADDKMIGAIRNHVTFWRKPC